LESAEPRPGFNSFAKIAFAFDLTRCFRNAASSLKTPAVYRRDFAPTTVLSPKR
jgi:hypothetical protein